MVINKNLTPNEEVIKNLLIELLKLRVNLVKIKGATLQLKIVMYIIEGLKNKKHLFTYKDLFNLLLGLMKASKTKETIAITSRIFELIQDAYKQASKLSKEKT